MTEAPRIFAGRYEVLDKLGQGGFATVYLARDMKLPRQVAVKVLDEQLSAKNPTIRKRFEREAHTVAQLSHPHIIHIYDSGQEEGRFFIVVPYLSGGDLDSLIKQRGALAIEQVLRITEEVGAALDYAHQRGVIHRDVKPANVMFDEHGQTILTDFGIVKVTDEATALTQTGMRMGTLFYMAPEIWVTGQVDHRADLYAFGVMVYQMLTGAVPFTGVTPHQIMYKHVNEIPSPPHKLNPTLSPAVDGVLAKMLEKSPAKRYQTAGRFNADLRNALLGNLDQTILSPGPVKKARKIPKTVWGGCLGLVVVLAAIVIAFFIGRGSGGSRPAVATVAEQTGGDATSSDLPAEALSIGEVSCWTHPQSSETEPVWSPDGEKLLFVSNRDGNREIYKMNADGVTTRLTHNPAADRQPVWSPRGDKLAFASNRDGNWEIYVLDSEGDVFRLTNNPARDMEPAWSPRTDKLAFASDRDGDWEIYTLDAEGQANQLTNNQVDDREPAWNPEGSKLAFASQRDGNWEIYMLGPDGQAKRMTNHPADDRQPAWSPDGGRLTFVSDRDGDQEIYWLDPTGQTVQITHNRATEDKPAWSPDGTQLSFGSNQPGNQEICTVATSTE